MKDRAKDWLISFAPDRRDTPTLEDIQEFHFQKYIRIIIKVAQAIDYAHTKSIIHRDIKPANVFLLDNETPQIADWETATDTSEYYSNSDLAIGTPSYLFKIAIHTSRIETPEYHDSFSLAMMIIEAICKTVEKFDQIMLNLHPGWNHGNVFSDLYTPQQYTAALKAEMEALNGPMPEEELKAFAIAEKIIHERGQFTLHQALGELELAFGSRI